MSWQEPTEPPGPEQRPAEPGTMPEEERGFVPESEVAPEPATTPDEPESPEPYHPDENACNAVRYPPDCI